jgi:hypothetical protein
MSKAQDMRVRAIPSVTTTIYRSARCGPCIIFQCKRELGVHSSKVEGLTNYSITVQYTKQINGKKELSLASRFVGLLGKAVL